jgi:Fibronectin type III domain
MAFPSNPAQGDQATVGGRLYRWDGAAWSFVEGVSPHAATHASGGGDAITISASQVSTGTFSADRLPIATTSSVGAVQVGSGLAIDSGVLSNTGVPGSIGLFNAYATTGVFPGTGQANTLYVATDTSRTYQYTGGVYVELGPGATIVAATLPGAPTSLTAAGGNGSATLTWSAPTNTGGSAITDYSIQYSSNGGTTWSTFSNSISSVTSSVVTGLTNGTMYTFRVAAVNSVGTGSYSSSTTATPASNVPGQPTALSASASGTTASLSWTAPASNGGSAITSYRVQSSTDGATWTTLSPTFPTATTASVASLSNATTYYFRVAAINTNGVGAYSASASVTTGAGVPGVPTSVTVSRTVGGYAVDYLQVSWTAPASNGGSTITGYDVQLHFNNGSTTIYYSEATAAQQHISIQVPASTYGTVSFDVRARNAAGVSEYSSRSNLA